ncbi:MAG: ABC transporter permease [Burkholderiales bacterium]|nr:ABC transporter permease [Anaerolineae bacterium]
MDTKSDAKPQAKAGQRTADVFRRLFAIPEVGVFIPLLAFVIIFYLVNPVFLSPANITTMLRSMAYIGIIAIGMTFLLITGAFDLSVGATAGLSAIVCSYAMVNMNLPIPLAVLAGLATGAAVGLVNGFVVLKLGVPAFIATLGMLNIAKGITYLISKGYTIYPLPDAIGEFGEAEPFGTSWGFVIFALMAIVAAFVFTRTAYGRKLYVVGGNQEVARLAGISPTRIQLSGFVLVSICSAVAGMLLMSRLATGQPTIGLGWELNVIAGVVIGGVSLFGGAGSILGAVIGLLIMQIVTSGLVISNVDPYWQTVAVGLIMIVAVAIDILRRKSKAVA